MLMERQSAIDNEFLLLIAFLLLHSLMVNEVVIAIQNPLGNFSTPNMARVCWLP